MSLDDAAFIVDLLTDPEFMRFVGDRGVKTIEDARHYIASGPLASYESHGFGLFIVEQKGSGLPVGICGLLKRPALSEVDIGFAFLPQYRGRGYASESTAATVRFGRATLGIERIVAIANPENAASVRILAKLGLRFARMITLSEDKPETGLYTFAARDLRIFTYDWIIEHGLPPTIREIGAHVSLDADDARRALADLKIGKTILPHPETGEIWMAGPFASSPTPYRVFGARASWWANCGWDMFGIPVITGEPVRIEASCTDCGESVTIHADPLAGTSDSAVVHFLLPARQWYDDIGFT